MHCISVLILLVSCLTMFCPFDDQIFSMPALLTLQMHPLQCLGQVHRPFPPAALVSVLYRFQYLVLNQTKSLEESSPKAEA
ncbi:uncharacterized protein EDB93DRAFT_1161860 [Suillus bovinus]|uniref:uncharacterized protein n=1 Tax=Suillus bovinus TaxID=48563 RepID=UPI001B86E749|nr:uncharacterized protein EDB93DRAFT_1161860 [Suillus bovinus]KAG2140204.1 hypothetical protein EDB93DRAFT_1161860 [Suillus bovinus]